MSGHSKWHQIRHKKAIVDKRRGKIFSKIIREIVVAAKIGGGNPDTNPRLRLAIQRARSVNMPMENIEKAIKRGTGELEGAHYEECIYEGYGPGGVAIMIEALTDNKNRTAAELRSIFSKNGGNMGESGCVAWQFHKKGIITVSKNVISEDELLNIVVDAGADDLKVEEEYYEIIVSPENFENVKNALEKNNIEFSSAEITMIPDNFVSVTDPNTARQLTRLLMALEDHEDIQHVHTNADIPNEVIEEIQ